jgi:RNA polymerase sigma-70 factor, ECF subfamily
MERTLRQIRDEHLALRCQSGEPAAFEELVRVMERPLLYFARTLVGDDETALDVLQAVWLSAFKGIRRLENPRALRPWLYRVTHGKAVDRVRGDISRAEAERRRAEENGEVLDEDEPAFDGEDARALHSAIARLDRAHREVIVLHFLEDLSVAEVAEVVGCPPGTVKSRIYHAKRALKEALRSAGHDVA